MVFCLCVCSLVAIPAGDFRYLLELIEDETVVGLAVRHAALFAVLDAFLCVGKIASAVLAERVEGAIAEKAVKFIFAYSFVTRKILAFLVAEKRVMLILPVGLTVIHSGASLFICCRERRPRRSTAILP